RGGGAADRERAGGARAWAELGAQRAGAGLAAERDDRPGGAADAPERGAEPARRGRHGDARPAGEVHLAGGGERGGEPLGAVARHPRARDRRERGDGGGRRGQRRGGAAHDDAGGGGEGARGANAKGRRRKATFG